MKAYTNIILKKWFVSSNGLNKISKVGIKNFFEIYIYFSNGSLYACFMLKIKLVQIGLLETNNTAYLPGLSG